MDEKKLMALAEALDSDNPKLKKEAEKAFPLFLLRPAVAERARLIVR